MTLRRWQLAFALAVLARVGAFVVLMAWPVPNELGQPVSPLIVQSGIDFEFYATMRQTLFHGGIGSVADGFAAFFGGSTGPSMFVSAPLLPILLELFDYGPGNTLPLALLYLLGGVVLVGIWLRWLDRQGVGLGWLCVFALMPYPVWLSVNISTDLLFALLFAGFYLSYTRGPGLRSSAQAAGFATVGLLARPNGITPLLFMLADGLRRISAGGSRRSWLGLAIVGAVFGVAGLYYLPQFLAYFTASGVVTYFGTSQSAYVDGIFPLLPAWLDHAASWFALAGAKLLYAVGIRPSYGETPLLLVLVRAAPGLILLPGLLYGLLRADAMHRILLAIFFLPIFLGAAQDRYNLPVQPLLFFFGVCWIGWLRERLPPASKIARPS